MTGRYLALSRDGRSLYALLPGRAHAATALIVVDAPSARVRARSPLALAPPSPAGSATLTAGPRTGDLYVVGADARRTAVHVLDPRTGELLRHWSVAGIGGQVLDAVIAPDERTLPPAPAGGAPGAQRALGGGAAPGPHARRSARRARRAVKPAPRHAPPGPPPREGRTRIVHADCAHSSLRGNLL